MAELVSQWEGREIIFPENSIFTIQGSDTVDFQFQDAPYKILMYVDSVGCMSCKLHLTIWNHFIQKLDSLIGWIVPVVIYMHSKDLEELSYITERDRFHHPVCFDEFDELNSLNHFPQNMMYQTFLLNSENRVVLIGNPVLSTDVRDSLYRKLGIEDKQNNKKTSVIVQADEINLGRMSQGDVGELRFFFTNVGGEALIVREVIPSCDCIEVEFSNVPILPKDNMELKVKYHAEDKGEFYKTVSVYANILESPIELMFYGVVN